MPSKLEQVASWIGRATVPGYGGGLRRWEAIAKGETLLLSLEGIEVKIDNICLLPRDHKGAVRDLSDGSRVRRWLYQADVTIRLDGKLLSKGTIPLGDSHW